MLKLLRDRGKDKSLKLSYRKTIRINKVAFDDCVVNWMKKFNIKIVDIQKEQGHVGIIRFKVIDEYYPGEHRNYCLALIGGTGYEIETDFVREIREEANHLEGTPVIITSTRLTKDATMEAKKLGVQFINESMIGGLNKFITNTDKVKIRCDSERFINRLTYYIKQTVQEMEV